MANKKKELGKSMEDTYFFDMVTDVKKGKAKPSQSFPEYEQEVSANVLKSAEHVERRMLKKDLNLRGNGRVLNKMFMLKMTVHDKQTGKPNTFWKNIGALKGRDKYNASKNLALLDDNLDDLYSDMEMESESDYEDGNKTALFGGGFTIDQVMVRTVVESSPMRVNQARLIMGARNLKVTRMV